MAKNTGILTLWSHSKLYRSLTLCPLTLDIEKILSGLREKTRHMLKLGRPDLKYSKDMRGNLGWKHNPDYKENQNKNTKSEKKC